MKNRKRYSTFSSENLCIFIYCIVWIESLSTNAKIQNLPSCIRKKRPVINYELLNFDKINKTQFKSRFP